MPSLREMREDIPLIADAILARLTRGGSPARLDPEAVTALERAPKGPAEIVNPTQAAFAQAALVNTPKFLLTGLATASGDPQVGVKTVFEKLTATLKSAGSGLPSVFYAYAYPADSNALQKYREVRFTFLDRQKAPASTNLVFEGLGDRDATIGIELLALPASEARP